MCGTLPLRQEEPLDAYATAKSVLLVRNLNVAASNKPRFDVLIEVEEEAVYRTTDGPNDMNNVQKNLI